MMSAIMSALDGYKTYIGLALIITLKISEQQGWILPGATLESLELGSYGWILMALKHSWDKKYTE